ncbi:MAG: tRNA uridine-5-carboxymethylaminomethyl(34) synthesis GTPase MnmE, partial [Gemmatimonadetes bacterium]|nr:tRNA uridine-5-carboxymethylaminomethyl(34) synthesis GTPase MnmE [Gemmatimonadota bacterium]
IRQLLPELAYSELVDSQGDEPILTRQRHVRLLKTARSEVELFRSSLVGGLPPEIASTYLRPAETALEEVLGVITVDDVLDVVFREFCVGK